MRKKKTNTPILLSVVRWLYPKLERWAPRLAERIFRLVFYVPLSYRVPEKETEAANAAFQSKLRMGNKVIQLYGWGDRSRPYILFVHGWAGRATQFRRFIAPVNEAGYYMLGFDGPAHGRSSGTKTSILEFEKVLKKIFEERGAPVAVITHSFGGAAVLFSMMNGLPVKILINIATPSVPDEILKTYLRAINGSWKSAERFKPYVKKMSGRDFEEFTTLYTIQHLPQPIKLLIVQDEDDQDVYALHADALLKIYPSAEIIRTQGLGHTRVLKDDDVISRCLSFIKENSDAAASL
ncbi:MAG TPA: alpha/beta hydrolase [Cyclobacteriaceae bacterium]|nr:alpha/beta hydrolase [Cyclobacteriaceae bacterium]